MDVKCEVEFEKRGFGFWMWINRPERRNALNREVIERIREGLRLAHTDPGIRVIVLSGRGDEGFCAGADLQAGAAFKFDFSTPNIDYADLLRDARSSTLPLVARVNGACMAGGMGLLCMTDMAVASEDARFGLPEVQVGVFPMQVMSLLQELVPQRLIREWALTGEPFGAHEARAAGLLNYVVPRGELDSKTEWLIERIAGKSPTAIRRGKHAMRTISSMSFEQSIAFAESQIMLAAMTEDAQEGIAAFNEKRRPLWTGR